MKKRVSRGELRPGDSIVTDCNGDLYYHHGIYVGNAKVTNPNNHEEQQEIDDAVIHFFGPNKKRESKSPCRRCFYMSQMEGVVISCLDCFLGGNGLYRYYYIFVTPDPPDEVIRTAFSYLMKERDFGGYDLFTNNCEHFAHYCKTGESYSVQVRTKVATVTALVTGCSVS